MGGRSGGCHACRKMKVKCDERKPGCFRCEKANRACPGYREEVDNFRSMNESTELRALELREKRRRSRDPSVSSIPDEDVHSLSLEQKRTPSKARLRQQTQRRESQASSSSCNPQIFLVPSVYINWEEQAIDNFLDAFSIQHGLMQGYFDFLPQIYHTISANDCFTDAIKAVAFMYLSKHSCIQSFAVQARRSYGKALVQASTKLGSIEESINDHVLATLSLLDLYEVKLLTTLTQGPFFPLLC
jgi:hypothetical protein